MRIKAVIFDLDNTLLDFIKMKKLATKDSAKAMVQAGLKMQEQEAYRQMRAFCYKNYRNMESDTAFIKLMKQMSSGNVRVFAAGVHAYNTTRSMHLRPYPQVKETLRMLRKRGIRTGVITDAPGVKAWQRLFACGIGGYFDVVVTRDDTRRRKPHQLPFRAAVRKLKLRPNEILFIGDQPHRDIRGARRAGMQTCLAAYGLQNEFAHYAEKYRADYVIGNVRDILKLVGRKRR
ncbi:MAG: HAD-IA family hydrolase [Candidatus Aenigmarchaeota archaeon]|nr:HAD-IA family hydrolase [Candidatus Aenigmarchaeota archaeon]